MTIMKQNLLVLGAVVALFFPVRLHAQDENKPAAPVDRDQLRQQFQNMSPEERLAKIRELREKGILPGDGASQRQFQGSVGSRLGGEIERIAMLLTPEQRESIRTAGEENREKTRNLEEKVRAARKSILDAALDKKFDEAALRQKLDSAAKLDIDLMVIRAKALSKVQPPLSDEQIEKIKNPPIGEMARQRAGQVPSGPAGNRDQVRPRPPGDGPRDANDLPPKQ